jgi:hypothetical protein
VATNNGRKRDSVIKKSLFSVSLPTISPPYPVLYLALYSSYNSSNISLREMIKRNFEDLEIISQNIEVDK